MKTTFSDEMDVRPFHEDDRYAVASLVRDILSEFDLLNNPGELTAEMARLTRRYSIDDAVFWVLLYNGEVYGCIGLRPHGEFTAEIERLYLRKKIRGRGIGTRLLKFVEEHAYKIGYRRLFISCPRSMERGIEFLEQMDYRMVGNAGEEADEDLFEKELF